MAPQVHAEDDLLDKSFQARSVHVYFLGTPLYDLPCLAAGPLTTSSLCLCRAGADSVGAGGRLEPRPGERPVVVLPRVPAAVAGLSGARAVSGRDDLRRRLRLRRVRLRAVLGGSVLRLHGGGVRAAGEQLRVHHLRRGRQPGPDRRHGPVPALRAAVALFVLRSVVRRAEPRRRDVLDDDGGAGRADGARRGRVLRRGAGGRGPVAPQPHRRRPRALRGRRRRLRAQLLPPDVDVHRRRGHHRLRQKHPPRTSRLCDCAAAADTAAETAADTAASVEVAAAVAVAVAVRPFRILSDSVSVCVCLCIVCPSCVAVSLSLSVCVSLCVSISRCRAPASFRTC